MEAVAQASRAAERRVHQPTLHRPLPGTRRACPELDCVAHLVRADVLDQAELRAERLGTGADRALIAMGELDEETYVRALSAALGVGFVALDDLPRAACPLPDGRLIEAAAAGVAALTLGDGPVWLVAPRHLAARGLIDLIGGGKARPCQFRLTTTARLDRFVLRTAGATIAGHAANGLHARCPLLSAGARPTWRTWATLALTIAIAALGVVVVPLAVEAALALFFIAWLALRLATAVMPRLCETNAPARGDRELPVYTVIAALYREARSVHGLLHSIERLDYPREKLDVLLAVEADDRETREAIADYAGQLGLRVIVVPAGPPRTKPRALNAALAFARGSLTVVYDAEDRPEPDQLRRADAAFAASGDRLPACRRACRSTIRTMASSLACSRQNMPDSSTFFSTGSARSACRCHWAVPQITSPPPRCAMWAAGTRGT